MASHLDLEEQEQLDQIKHFWKTYGNLITWALIVVFGGFAAWNGYQYWQRQQATQASAMYDEVERAVQSGDVTRMERSLADMKDRFGSTAFAQQAALLTAKAVHDKGRDDAARAALSWVVDKSSDEGYRAIAALRLAGVLVQAKAYDEALKVLGGSFPKEFEGLVADRKGDVLTLQAKRKEAAAEYTRALGLLDAQQDYRRLVEVKLNAMGVAVPPRSAASAGGKS